MRRRSPQEKKALSYSKDRRNTYGENDKASRKSVPQRKADVNRVYRRKINQILTVAGNAALEGSEAAEGSVRSLKRNDWKKSPDTPLGEVVQRKLERRANRVGLGKTARKKAIDFVRSLRIETDREADRRWTAKAVGMNGVAACGSTKSEAIESCRMLARIVFLESIGSLAINSVDGSLISVTTK